MPTHSLSSISSMTCTSFKRASCFGEFVHRFIIFAILVKHDDADFTSFSAWIILCAIGRRLAIGVLETRSFANSVLDEWHRFDTEKMLRSMEALNFEIKNEVDYQLDVIDVTGISEEGVIEFLSIIGQLFSKINAIIDISSEKIHYEKPEKWAQKCWF